MCARARMYVWCYDCPKIGWFNFPIGRNDKTEKYTAIRTWIHLIKITRMQSNPIKQQSDWIIAVEGSEEKTLSAIRRRWQTSGNVSVPIERGFLQGTGRKLKTTATRKSISAGSISFDNISSVHLLLSASFSSFLFFFSFSTLAVNRSENKDGIALNIFSQ